jgi:hypothetical protein
LRGFARNSDRYYAFLSNADGVRQGALDGRGNLSEIALVAWIDYVLDTSIDQVSFMARGFARAALFVFERRRNHSR